MTEDDNAAARLFEGIRTVEWHNRKNAANRGKHGIDFDEALEVFYTANMVRRSDRNEEERWIAVGESEGRIITVVFTRRGNALRIISARRARKNEERAYRHEALGRTPDR
jgi:uncharacterized DUF497 family protein